MAIQSLWFIIPIISSTWIPKWIPRIDCYRIIFTFWKCHAISLIIIDFLPFPLYFQTPKNHAICPLLNFILKIDAPFSCQSTFHGLRLILVACIYWHNIMCYCHWFSPDELPRRQFQLLTHSKFCHQFLFASWYLEGRFPLRTESYHDDNFVVTGGIRGYRDDNLWCRQWLRSWHHDNSLIS